MSRPDRASDGSRTRRSNFNHLSKDTLSYYEEVGRAIGDTPEEDRSMVADNALVELGEQVVEVSGDPTCSRILEKLLPYVTAPKLIDYIDACFTPERIGAVCTGGPFVSRVVEAALTSLFGRWSGSHASDDSAEHWDALGEAIQRVADALSGSLYEASTCKQGSFIVRRFLTLCAGRDVSRAPATKSGAAAPSSGEGGEPEGAAGDKKQAGSRVGGLQAKLAFQPGSQAAQSYEPACPPGISQLCEVVLEEAWAADLPSLRCDEFASPVLQALTRASAWDPALSARLITALLGDEPSRLQPDAVRSLMQDRCGSHLMEAVFETAGDDQFQKLSSAALKGAALALAQHASANFALQAALAAMRKPAQLRRVAAELLPALGQLLRARRGGVAAALAGAWARLLPSEADFPEALWRASQALRPDGDGLVALLELDSLSPPGQGVLDAAAPSPSQRLSSLGCAVLAAVLACEPAACRPWAEALCALSSARLQRVARDQGGVRVVEAYLQANAGSPKRVRGLLQSLAGAWGAVAVFPAGARFVECAFGVAAASDKQVVAEELQRVAARLSQSKFGRLLLSRTQVDSLRSSGADAWQRKLQMKQSAAAEFNELFGSEEGKKSGDDAGELPASKKKRREEDKKDKRKKKQGEEMHA